MLSVIQVSFEIRVGGAWVSSSQKLGQKSLEDVKIFWKEKKVNTGGSGFLDIHLDNPI